MGRILRARSTRVSQGSQSNGPKRTIEKTLGLWQSLTKTGWFSRQRISIYTELFIRANCESKLFESKANRAKTAEISSGYMADNEDSEAEEDAESDEDTESDDDAESNEDTESNEEEVDICNNTEEDAESNEDTESNEEEVDICSNIEDDEMADDTPSQSSYKLDNAADISPTGYDGILSPPESVMKLYDEIDEVCLSDTEMYSELTYEKQIELRVFKETWLKKSSIRVKCDQDFNYVDEDMREIQLGVSELNDILSSS